MQEKEIFHIEVMIEKELPSVLHACLSSQVGVSTFAELWDEIYRHVAVVEGYNSSHRTATAASCPSQDIHSSDQVRNGLLTTRHIWLWDDIKSLDVCEIEWKPGFQHPDGMKEQSNLPDKETYWRCHEPQSNQQVKHKRLTKYCGIAPTRWPVVRGGWGK